MNRQPLATAAALGGTVIALAALLGVTITQDQVSFVVTAIATLGPLISAGIALAGAHGKVTPVQDPRDVDGAPLVRETS